MKIVTTQYSLDTKTLEIYVGGCNRNCKGCHNPELQSFEIGTDWKEEIDNILNKIEEFDSVIDNIWLLGGEWLDQDLDDAVSCIKRLQSTDKIIWLFTGYERDDIDERIIECIDYVKCGCYNETQIEDNYYQFGIKLATKNQYIIKFDKN